MADGCGRFNFPLPQVSQLEDDEISVDLFAGGGGASEAVKQALGIDPALAYNHDEWAIGMHAANHAMTEHHREDIWHANPVTDVAGRRVGWFHASPDCTHFSQAKGGQPRNRKIRALTWVVLKWVGQLAAADARNGTNTMPRILSLENVWQILTWGPLVAKRDKTTGRVLKMDGTVASRGERVPLELQQLVPDKRHAGRTWAQFVAALQALGYVVEWRKLVASDYGAGTSRERLFLIARRDGKPIVWPAPTHGKAPGLKPMMTAAECIDFTDIGTSIFNRPKPLADATLRRLAGGLVRNVLEAEEPFFLTEFANVGRGGRTWSGAKPLPTQCANVKGGHFAIAAPALVKFKGNSIGHPITDPVPTITAGGACARPAGAAHSLAVMTAHMVTLRQHMAGASPFAPLSTITAGGQHHGVVLTEVAPADVDLTAEQQAGAIKVAAFLVNYYGNGTSMTVRDPLDTVTTRDRIALVTVVLDGETYVIVDIFLRMLRPRELFLAQGFPAGYVIDRTADGRRITISAAVRMVGNSVSPPPLRALIEANLDPFRHELRMAA